MTGHVDRQIDRQGQSLEGREGQKENEKERTQGQREAGTHRETEG